MVQKIILFFIFLIFLVFIAIAIAIDNRISTVDYEMQQQIEIQRQEIEELKKNQRIATQDIQFLENLVVKGEIQ